jgi:hypothetical protein
MCRIEQSNPSRRYPPQSADGEDRASLCLPLAVRILIVRNSLDLGDKSEYRAIQVIGDFACYRQPLMTRIRVIVGKQVTLVLLHN